MKNESVLTVDGQQVKLSNLDKVLYPKTGFTKGQVIDYYIRVSPWLLPHLKDRPLTLKRYPEGVEGGHFYEKECPPWRPKWVKTAKVARKLREGDVINYCLANNLATLVWASNLADIELHTTLGKARNPERPTMLVFDLDPGPLADLLNCVDVAFWVKQIFDAWKLQAFPKVSGSKGMQIYIPLNTPITFEQTKPLAQSIAELLERQHPKEVVSKQAKELRRSKVLVDWSQNEFFKTTVCVYSLRAKDAPTVSMPVTWAELEKARRSGNKESLMFDAEAALKRLNKVGDLFEPVLTLKQKLPKTFATLDKV